MGSSYRNGSSYVVGVTSSRTSDEKSVSADSSPSRIGDRSVRSSTGDPICNFAAGGAGLDISYPGW